MVEREKLEHSSSDTSQRLLALNSVASFIVQAPAGSGKTTLLVQRFLKLLASVDHPEEILAITFTRKAAAEMRARVINALQHPQDPLATAALRQNTLRDWNILVNRDRLRIETIDAFCYRTLQQSALTAQPAVNLQILPEDEVEFLYIQAAQETLKQLECPEFSELLQSFLLYLGNDWERATNLLVAMLASREQWLPHLVGHKNTQELREWMEKELAIIAQEYFAQVVALFPQEQYQELVAIMAELAVLNPDCGLALSKVVPGKPRLEQLSLDELQQLGRLLFTKELSWRKVVTKEQGFALQEDQEQRVNRTVLKELKQRMITVLKQLAQVEALAESLRHFLLAPPLRYPDQQWKIIEVLLEVLPLAVANLKVLFDEERFTDYAEIAMNVTQALGSEEEPSELYLKLDYQLKHILFDEFQDTSLAQYRLLEKLVVTWREQDGRTLFLVGDPMQSIYRFRNAEVGIFLRVQTQGIGYLRPQPLYLTANFRSTQPVVEWVNQVFDQILPATADIGGGGVPFSPSQSVLNQADSQVTISLFEPGSAESEADRILERVQQLQRTYPEQTIAILAKSRSQLRGVLARLRSHNLPYQGVDLEPLGASLVVRDLFSLTKALANPWDKLAWLAILRAPWCGLSLNDLYRIAQGAQPLVWENILDASLRVQLSPEGQTRLTCFLDKFTPYYALVNRVRWSDLISRCWLAIGGPATVERVEELDYAQTYLAALPEYELHAEKLARKLRTLFAYSPATGAKLFIMTIHKAKGLEFDHVIIPAINRATRSDEHQLLMWCERTNRQGDSSLILAPINQGHLERESTVYNYLRLLEQERAFYEEGRLLYVAVTRAKRSAHLFGAMSADSRKAPAGSFLEQLLPVLDRVQVNRIDATPQVMTSETLDSSQTFRLTQEWCAPLVVPGFAAEHNFSYRWEDDQAAILGTVAHQVLYQLAEYKLNFQAEDIEEYLAKLLRQEGYRQLEHGVTALKTMIAKMTTEERGRWILANHKRAENELSLVTELAGQRRVYRIDRTFIDETDTRWLIDYKTSSLGQASIAEFLRQEQEKYAPQLLIYQRLLAQLDGEHPIRAGLYFPMFGGWIELGAS